MRVVAVGTVRFALVLWFAVSGLAAQTTRDSAGIQIVDNARPTWAPDRQWRLSERPIFDIGGATSPDQEFGRIVDVIRLSDGRIVVGDGDSYRLSFYDASGRQLLSVGGRGQGPGELRDFHAITRLPGDSIAVEMTRGATIFAPNGAFVRNVQFGPLPAGALQMPMVAALDRFDNGTAVVLDYPQGERRPAGARQWIDSSSLFLVDATGAVVRRLGTTPVVIFTAGAQHPSPMELGPQIVHASSGRAIYLGFSNEFAIRVYDPDWKLQRIIRRAWTPRRLTRTEIDGYVDGWMAMWSRKTGAEREAERREMRDDTYPEVVPAYAAILATPTGEIWVREPDLTGAPGCWCLAGMPTVQSKWSVFDPTGRWLGDVSMPARFIPLEVGADYVLGRSRGADDVPHAVMYRLEKPR